MISLVKSLVSCKEAKRVRDARLKFLLRLGSIAGVGVASYICKDQSQSQSQSRQNTKESMQVQVHDW